MPPAAGTWLFLAIAALGTLFSLVLLYYAPTSVMAWLFFFSIAPFAAGSLLFIRASYPECVAERAAVIACSPGAQLHQRIVAAISAGRGDQRMSRRRRDMRRDMRCVTDPHPPPPRRAC